MVLSHRMFCSNGHGIIGVLVEWFLERASARCRHCKCGCRRDASYLLVALLCFLNCFALAHAPSNIVLLWTVCCRNCASHTYKPCNGWPRATRHLNTHGYSQYVRPVSSFARTMCCHIREARKKKPKDSLVAIAALGHG